MKLLRQLLNELTDPPAILIATRGPDGMPTVATYLAVTRPDASSPQGGDAPMA